MVMVMVMVIENYDMRVSMRNLPPYLVALLLNISLSLPFTHSSLTLSLTHSPTHLPSHSGHPHTLWWQWVIAPAVSLVSWML